MATRSDDIRLLNELVEVTIDSMDGYRAAAGDSGEPGLRELFRYRAQERRIASELLRRQVRALGGEPRDEGSVLASAHRVFMNLRNRVQDDDAAVIAEVERGENHIRAKYEAALAAGRLTPSSRHAVLQAYESVLTGQDEASHMAHALHPGQDRE
ncbi:PA2169 family four-helix-bundle protein [Fulvimonas sp. R45]|uniref:PA2169 family four-helix-bundle protein n=1 Tax=Fulvimonas sp. R45 TaxID=3045937 RepID=UPI00266039B8|nr:PA2169 family four-helix-bundle protein [Fulvimonas sp. R45]MDO1527217.1 PA2169 family four-helix-bundle protein [Fulvimonas sp. R45]